MKKANTFQLENVQLRALLTFCLMFFANFSLALRMKVSLIQKSVYNKTNDKIYVRRLMNYSNSAADEEKGDAMNRNFIEVL